MSIRIPLWLLRDLKCRHCKNFLSSGPVYLTPDCGMLCGRCRALAKPNFRNYIYEELANTFKFPCLNWSKHCRYEDDWNTIKEHEIDCKYNSKCNLICIDPSAFFSSERNLPSVENLLYIEIPDKCLNVLSCKNCGKYLSCEPIHINVTGSNICHRCYLSNGIPPHTLRNLGYEKIANIFRFPCIFRSKGCPIKFKFGRDSWEHEIVCHYKDIQIISQPSTPQLNGYLCPLNGLDDSGYRPSFEGSSSLFSNSSFHKDRPKFELPRVSLMMKNHDTIKEEIKEVKEVKVTQDQVKFEVLEIKDKERGIVPTHTGHIYATLTQNTILFAPPQIQPNKDPSDGMKVTKEFQEKVKRNASNASRNESFMNKEEMNDFVDENDNDIKQNIDFPALNKVPINDIENLAPVVKEYVQHNPQNNVQRNDSMTIGNADLIAELRKKQELRKKNKEKDESLKRIEVY